MRGRVLAGLVAAAGALVIPGAALAMTLPGPQTTVHVTPDPVGQRTPVVVSFRQSVNTTRSSPLVAVERLQVSGPVRHGCISGGAMTVPPLVVGARVKLTLRPSRFGSHWCLGTYQGTLTVSMMPRCTGPPLRACPQFVVAPRTVGRFSFRVTARRRLAD